MIAGCPKCSARYRVDASRVGEGGAKLRCTKCSAVFLVRAPKAAVPEPAAAAPAVAAPPVAEATSTPPVQSSPSPAVRPDTAPGEVDSSRLVLVADPDEERGKASVAALESWGLATHLVHDGVEAMLQIQRMLPSAVVLDAALPKMFGFQICEVMKRNESLRETRVVLVGAIHHDERYRREPTDLYGADVYLEQPDLPEGLFPILRDAGLPVRDSSSSDEGAPSAQASESPVESPAPTVATPPVTPPLTPSSTPSAATSLANDSGIAAAAAPSIGAPETQTVTTPETPAPAPPTEVSSAGEEDPETVAERERAERLARIAVSEMLLYQPEKFEQAVRDGNLEDVLDLEIQEARALLRQRISEEVRAERDFIIEELNRVAAERGGQG